MKVSNAPSDGYFLQAQSGDTGGLRWSQVTLPSSSTLSGTTLASGITASSITSLGTLTGLTVNGNVSITGALFFGSGSSCVAVRGDLPPRQHEPVDEGDRRRDQAEPKDAGHGPVQVCGPGYDRRAEGGRGLHEREVLLGPQKGPLRPEDVPERKGVLKRLSHPGLRKVGEQSEPWN